MILWVEKEQGNPLLRIENIMHRRLRFMNVINAGPSQDFQGITILLSFLRRKLEDVVNGQTHSHAFVLPQVMMQDKPTIGQIMYGLKYIQMNMKDGSIQIHVNHYLMNHLHMNKAGASNLLISLPFRAKKLQTSQQDMSLIQ